MGLRMWQEPEVLPPTPASKIDPTAAERSAIRRRRREEQRASRRRRLDTLTAEATRNAQEFSRNSTSRHSDSEVERNDFDFESFLSDDASEHVDSARMQHGRTLLRDAMRHEHPGDWMRLRSLRRESTLRYEVTPRETLIAESGAGAARASSPEYEGPFPIRGNHPLPMTLSHEAEPSPRIHPPRERRVGTSQLPLTRNFAPAQGPRQSDEAHRDSQFLVELARVRLNAQQMPRRAGNRWSPRAPRAPRSSHRHADDPPRNFAHTSEPHWENHLSDGLGDRRRSLSPDEMNAWSTIHATIMPDERLPSAESSFTSATASSFSSERASQNTAPETIATSTSSLPHEYSIHCDEPSEESEGGAPPYSDHGPPPARTDSTASFGERVERMAAINAQLQELERREGEVRRYFRTLADQTREGVPFTADTHDINHFHTMVDRIDGNATVPGARSQASDLSTLEPRTSRMDRERL